MLRIGRRCLNKLFSNYVLEQHCHFDNAKIREAFCARTVRFTGKMLMGKLVQKTIVMPRFTGEVYERK